MQEVNDCRGRDFRCIIRRLRMGMFDTIMVPCPQCGKEEGFQTKSGPCQLEIYVLATAPADALQDVNRHAPQQCDNCGTWFAVEFRIEPAKVLEAKAVVAQPKIIS